LAQKERGGERKRQHLLHWGEKIVLAVMGKKKGGNGAGGGGISRPWRTGKKGAAGLLY